MPMPSDIGAIDLMIGFPAEDARRHYDYMKANFKDEASAEMEFPAEYMFKDVPNHKEPEDDAIAITLGEMDKYGVAMAMTSCRPDVNQRALSEHPDRFFASIEIDADNNDPGFQVGGVTATPDATVLLPSNGGTIVFFTEDDSPFKATVYNGDTAARDCLAQAYIQKLASA